MIMKEVAQLRPTFLHIRGDFLRNDEKTGMLTPGVLQAVAPALPPAAQRTRLDLAKWLISPDNPLTPRVTMNRVWMRYFGRGIVETEEDFGTQGSPPTHPELLDWLASEFIRRGWSLKAMHRLIVTSATYRQSSHARADIAERDPRNLLLARQERCGSRARSCATARFRRAACSIPTIGGPSVHPPQPEGVYAFTQTGEEVGAGHRPESIPARALHAVLSQLAVSAVHDLRRAGFPETSARDARGRTLLCRRSTWPTIRLSLKWPPHWRNASSARFPRMTSTRACAAHSCSA
jgi:hypothetical protein